MHDGMVLRPPYVVQQRSGDDEIHVRLRDAFGDDLGHGTDGGAVHHDTFLAAGVPQKIDAFLVGRDPVSHPC